MLVHFRWMDKTTVYNSSILPSSSTMTTIGNNSRQTKAVIYVYHNENELKLTDVIRCNIDIVFMPCIQTDKRNVLFQSTRILLCNRLPSSTRQNVLQYYCIINKSQGQNTMIQEREENEKEIEGDNNNTYAYLDLSLRQNEIQQKQEY